MTKHTHILLGAALCLLFVGSCMSARTIKAAGLKGLSLGEPMPEEHVTRLLGHPAHDTVIDEGGYSWRAMIIQYPNGKVLVESDFSNMDIINRIQVMASDLRYQKNITVGSTVASLDQLGGKWYVSHLPDYGRVDIAFQGLHFLISDEFVQHNDPETLKPERIPRDAPILSIVLM
ncbi:MAG: hypothetical protein R3B47_00315 [Bacteroidia bacterium]